MGEAGGEVGILWVDEREVRELQSVLEHGVAESREAEVGAGFGEGEGYVVLEGGGSEKVPVQVLHLVGGQEVYEYLLEAQEVAQGQEVQQGRHESCDVHESGDVAENGSHIAKKRERKVK